MKNIKISPYFSIYGIVLLYMLLSGLAMFITLQLENFSFQYYVGFLEILSFALITYFLNNYYFQKINLKPPRLIGVNTTVLISLSIGIFFALIINFPYRIYATIKSGYFEYLFLVFGLKNFIMAIGAGVFEEITFRGTLLNFYNQKNKKYLGLIISSLIFGLIHITNSFVGIEVSFIYIIRIIIFGFLYGFIYLNFGIIASITTHSAGNFLIGGFVKPTWYGSYYSLGIATILCIWLFLRDRRKQKIQIET